MIAAGSPVEDDELVFRTLQGLPTAFNGLKTAVKAIRSRGHKVCFNELITMLKSEENQLSKETTETDKVSTVLVATHGNQSQSHATPGILSSIPSVTPLATPQSSIGASSSQFAAFPPTPQQQFQYFPQNFSQNFRPFNKGRGGRYVPREPCDICGKNNHSTNYCYYRPNNMSFDGPSSQWRGYLGFSQSLPWTNYMMLGFPQNNITMFQGVSPQMFKSPAQNTRVVRSNGGFMSVSQSIPQMPFPSIYGVPQYASQMPPPTAFAGFTEGFVMPPFSSGPYGSYFMLQTPTTSSTVYNSYTYNNSATQPWYFDSGATNHITNNMQNLNLEHP